MGRFEAIYYCDKCGAALGQSLGAWHLVTHLHNCCPHCGCALNRFSITSRHVERVGIAESIWRWVQARYKAFREPRDG
jgi:hypothetical protein